MNDREPVQKLTESECWEHLATQSVGRIATRVRELVDIVPVNYVICDGGLVIRTSAGSKLAGLTITPAVTFEVDLIGETGAWSVVIHGQARILDTDEEIAAAEELPLRPYVATRKPTFVRIEVDAITGNSFIFGPEPEVEQEG
ncbi:pyridoxamine 5'-phosphate oxidase family protein [Leucobacter denitrificans]|uniref:Pyridoxamine 5'-phosphate oxidase family protein n=1 Tax=Leucobacter denitrificans TaxID=683042 RepID=A0A7G9S6Z7_9MICO|nr:pyridoxamine 5'-phosphate oxidase family protein [Leucobacter denitrificans]QNN63622.1 pyridoxamine 5'-phosphate oxidase family protein [Leucobacter denitrificans]